MNQEIESLRQQLAISEAEGLEQARLLGMSGEREVALLAEIDRLCNQLAAANAELVRKQARDSQYSNVCCKLSANENEVVQLRQQLAEKDAEIEFQKNAHGQAQQLLLEQGKQLAASQAREQQLREALEITHDLYAQSTSGYGFYRPANPNNFYPDLDCCSHDEIAAHSKACEDYKSGRAYGNDSWGIGAYCDEYLPALDALALPSDTTALSAMIAKAGEVMRESVIEQCIAMCVMSRDGAFVEEIRALPGVTMDDLK